MFETNREQRFDPLKGGLRPPQLGESAHNRLWFTRE